MATPCRACDLEAELGTEEVPHPVDPRVHSCTGLAKPAVLEKDIPTLAELQSRMGAVTGDVATMIRCVSVAEWFARECVAALRDNVLSTLRAP